MRSLLEVHFCLSYIAETPHERLPGAVNFTWGFVQEESFSLLKPAVISVRILDHFIEESSNEIWANEICTNDSGHGIGVVLTQNVHGTSCVMSAARSQKANRMLVRRLGSLLVLPARS